MTTEFRLHVWSPVPVSEMPTTSLEAGANLHGAALALREFTLLGYDVTPFGAHIDMKQPGGKSHTVLVIEVLDWLRLPAQIEFVSKEQLAPLFDIRV